jgi:rhamnose transport system ATP-binding protein
VTLCLCAQTKSELVTPLLAANGISKSFAGVRALRGVSFDLHDGEVHALIGENGAGKSTLIRIMTGAEKADAGTLMIGDELVAHMDPAAARARGIAAIYQQPSLFPDLTVAENIAIACETQAAWRRINWQQRRRRAIELLARIGAEIDPERPVDTLSMPEQQLVEIAKALGSDARILIMDEPTASLPDREVETLLEVVRRLRSHGVGIIYISHRLDEVMAIADRVTVLRDGETVATVPADAADSGSLIRMMVGRELSAVFPKRPVAVAPSVALELRQVSSRASGIYDVSFAVGRGEIVGVAGLVGAGRTQLAETIFGLTPPDGGEILIDGRRVTIQSPSDAIANGIGYLPEDRRRHGVIAEMSVAANTTLASLEAVSRAGLIDRGVEHRDAERQVEQLRVKTVSVGAEVGTLSGGNQQKVALARWLRRSLRVMIMDEPTQGIDVGSKAEIHALMQDLAERGLAIVMISSELPEILGMSDRVVVMHGGTVAGILARAEATQERILSLTLFNTAAVDGGARQGSATSC